MALNADKLVKISNLHPASDLLPTLALWHYVTTDTLVAVMAAGYFNDVRDLFQVGDEILVVGAAGFEIIKFATVPATGNITTVQLGTGLKIVRGMHTTVAAADTVATGLTLVQGVIVSLDSDPVDGAMHVTASVGDQAGAPAAGSVLINTWKSTDGDATLIAATTFGKLVAYLAFGT